MPKCLNVFFRKSARHLDFWRLGFSILLQKSVVYRPITSKEDSKGRRMDMAMIFSSSKRWRSIFFIFYITEPPRSPFIFDFCLMQPVTKFFIAFFGGSYVLRSSGAPWGAPYNYLKSWTWLRSVFPKQIILIIPTNNRYILNLYGILRFFYPIIWEIGLLGAPWGAPWLHKFYHRKIWTKTYKKHIYHFFI